MDNNTLELKIFLNRSKLRKEVLKELNNSEQVATFLAEKMKKHRSVISRVLIDLKNKNLAVCVNPESANYRKYSITKLGKSLL